MSPRDARRIGAALAVATLAVAAGENPAAATERFPAAAVARVARPPLGLPPVPVPPDNPVIGARVELGRKLFFDRRLSHNGTMSCAMCHIPEQGFTNVELARPVGIEGRSLRRNSPTIFNAAYVAPLFHDGRETSLETQVVGPLLERSEMANPSIGHVIAKLRALPDYEGWFERAFGAGPSVDRLGQALAAYQRTLLSANSPFDRWRFGGEAEALRPEAVRGFRLFTGTAGCVACHTIEERHALLTDNAFHDTGIGWYNATVRDRARDPVSVEIAPGVTVAVDRDIVDSVGDPEPPDRGRHEVTLDPADLWKFRTPSLRNVGLTPPYMHDGSLRTLEEVVRFYDRGGHRHPGLDPRIRPLGLSDAEVGDLVAFLESLTGDNVDILIQEARDAAAAEDLGQGAGLR
jgi:cytochrome c peroxidase